MASSTGSLAALLDPGYRFVFFNWLGEHPMEYTAVFNTLDSERAYEEDLVVAGLGAVPEKPEGTSIIYDDPIQGSEVRYTHRSYGMGFRVTEEMYEDDLYGVVKKVVMALARSAKHTHEAIVWDVLNFAFSATRPGQDGLALCNTAHTLLGGGTYGNRPTTDTDLNATSLQQAVDTFERMVDHRGLPAAISAKRLVIPPELKWRTREILNSAYIPGSADNDINALKEEGITYKMSHYLGSATAWWLTGDKDEHDLKCYERRGTRMRSADDFDSGDMKSKVDFRKSAGFTNWTGVYGTTGGA